MTGSRYKVFGRMQSLMLVILLVFVYDTLAAHQLTVNPSQPTSESTITIVATGVWPSGGEPSLQQWGKNGQSIRIDALGTYPGIPTPTVPYQLEIDLGELPPGQYQADYYVEIIAFPEPPPGMAAIPQSPNASISFEVLAVAEPLTTESVPALSTFALAIMSLLLLLPALIFFHEKHRASAKSDQRLGTR